VKSEVALDRNVIVAEDWLVTGAECGSQLVLQSDICIYIYIYMYNTHITIFIKMYYCR
jgi:hypothetical protein